jgi:hypothetical protein
LGDAPDERRVGQILWELTALANLHGVDAENALRSYVVMMRKRLQDSQMHVNASDSDA